MGSKPAAALLAAGPGRRIRPAYLAANPGPRADKQSAPQQHGRLFAPRRRAATSSRGRVCIVFPPWLRPGGIFERAAAHAVEKRSRKKEGSGGNEAKEKKYDEFHGALCGGLRLSRYSTWQ
ncbi:uncharacterized protein UV8b_06855 [Ustilaginoidea virens]|uniref:Uncharacterized protein n=1 Tax=Ustilaginoidea virens TaxID=1159556 RepID=A0A8E5HW03_USTVR|nr:uncharacterized protein UV8b_06855 [Ustilaginoidea virens]QUC22614.1 hypothetical protein UV8b_06855 [Ustilaginoidea virens]